METLSLASQIALYVLLALIGLNTLLIWGWQIQVFRGKEMKNSDGSVDSWHEQKIFYGISVADVFLACPVSIIGIILVFASPRWGFYLLALISFWLLWANIMTTATSLRFEKPKFTLSWFFVFPFGALVGLAYLIWTFVHVNIIF
jgi:hypothetical protein